MHPPTPRPPGIASAGRPRHLAPDLARGFMLLLIAMAYAPLYVTGGEAGINHHPLGGPADRVVNALYLLLVDNRSYTMFAALFGYGLATVAARRTSAGGDERAARRELRRRGLLLLLFGFVHGVLVFPGEILGAYGLAALALGGLMFRPERVLLRAAAAAAGAFTLLVPLGVYAMAYGAPGEPGAAVPGYTAVDLAVRLLGYPVGPLFNLLAYPTVVALLVGAWAGRRALLADPVAHRALLRRTAAAGIGVSLAGALPAALAAAELWRPGLAAEVAVMTAQILTGVLGGLGYAALFGLLAARAGDRPGPAARALAATGSRSLTFYLAHSAALALLLSSSFLGLGGHVRALGAALIAAAVWAAGVGAAVLLERAGRPGPADALLRRLVRRGRAHGGQSS